MRSATWQLKSFLLFCSMYSSSLSPFEENVHGDIFPERAEAVAESAARTRSIGVDPSPACCCRNRRIVGYQGLSSRSSSQRQQVSKRLSNQTGLPSAPAKCATEVSTLITRSNASTRAAV